MTGLGAKRPPGDRPAPPYNCDVHLLLGLPGKAVIIGLNFVVFLQNVGLGEFNVKQIL